MLRFLFYSFAVLLLAQPSVRASGQAPTAPPPPLTLAQVWTLNATYNDPQRSVSFRYPSVWIPTAQLAYLPAALGQSDQVKPIAGFAYSEGGFPRARVVGPYSGTNLESVGLVYAAVPLADTAQCEAMAASLSNSPKRPQVNFGGRSFSVHETGSAGMSHSISGTLYATFANATCYLFETDLATVSPGVLDGIQALTPAQLHSIDNHLLDMMNSLRISSR